MQEEDKLFFKKINPYGFLLSIPIHSGMNTLELKKELEEVLERKDFLFFIDQEGGAVNRLKHFISGFPAPAPQTFGKRAKTDLNKAVREVYEYGLRTGRALELYHDGARRLLHAGYKKYIGLFPRFLSFFTQRSSL